MTCEIASIVSDTTHILETLECALVSDHPEEANQFGEIRAKIQASRLRVACVGGVKSGKTTLSLALTHPDVLPHRTSACTLVPTIISHRTCANNNSLVHWNFRGAHKLQPCIRALFDLLVADPAALLCQHQQESGVLEQVCAQPDFAFPEEGEMEAENVHDLLLQLNDLTRVVHHLAADEKISSDITPLVVLEWADYPRVGVAFEAHKHFPDVPSNMELVDLPGPDEHGLGLLSDVVIRACMRSHLIMLTVNSRCVQTSESAAFYRNLQTNSSRQRTPPKILVVGNQIDSVRSREQKDVPFLIARHYQLGSTNQVVVASGLCARLGILGVNNSADPAVRTMGWYEDFGTLLHGQNWDADATPLDEKAIRSGGERLLEKSNFANFVPHFLQALLRARLEKILGLLPQAQDLCELLVATAEGRILALQSESATLENKARTARKDLEKNSRLLNRTQEHYQTINDRLVNTLEDTLPRDLPTSIQNMVPGNVVCFKQERNAHTYLKDWSCHVDEEIRKNLLAWISQINESLEKSTFCKEGGLLEELFSALDHCALPQFSLDMLVMVASAHRQQRLGFSSLWSGLWNSLLGKNPCTCIPPETLRSFASDRYAALRREVILRYTFQMQKRMYTCLQHSSQKLHALDKAYTSAQQICQQNKNDVLTDISKLQTLIGFLRARKERLQRACQSVADKNEVK